LSLGSSHGREVHLIARRTLDREGRAQHVGDGPGEVECHGATYLFGNVFEVWAIALGQDYLGQTCPMRRQDLLLHAANRQDPALERHLAGHPYDGTYWHAAKQTHQRRRHRNARGRSVLGYGSRGHVEVKALVREELWIDVELFGV